MVNLGGKASIAIACVGLVLLCTVQAVAAQGIFTEQQAAEGKSLYEAHCASCHGKSLMDGTSSALIGIEFIERWGAKAVEGSPLWAGLHVRALLTDTIETMPPGLIGSIPDDDQLLILIYMLQRNGFPAGDRALTLNAPALDDRSHTFEPTVGRIGREQRLLVWVDRTGKEEVIPAPPRHYYLPRLSPDGTHIAVEVIADTAQIWIVDVKTGNLRQLTFDGTNRFPLWNPDGTRVLYSSDRHRESSGEDGAFFDGHQVFWQAADGSDTPEQLTFGAHNHGPQKWSPDGKTLSFYEIHPETYRDIWMLPIGSNETPWPFLTTPHLEGGIGFSANGAWLAYTSKETGRYEVKIRSFPDGETELPITVDGGVEVVWPLGSTDLFYRNGDKRMAVQLSVSDTVAVGTHRVVFEGNYVNSPGSRASWDSLDGERFLLVKKAVTVTATTQ